MPIDKQDGARFWWHVPPWILLGSVAVLLPLFIFMTVVTLNRQRQTSISQLLEKGAALIRSFEAGTRTGMMGGLHRGTFKLQSLLTQTAQQPDIAYLLVTDGNGRVIAHSDLTRIGTDYGRVLDLHGDALEQLRWREVELPDGRTVFEVYRKFSPTGRPPGISAHGRRFPFGRTPGPQPPGEARSSEPLQMIFVGLETAALKAAQRDDARQTILMSVTFLLLGFGGIVLLFLTQSYRTTRTSLSRVQAFSDHLVESMPVGLIATDANQNVAAFNQVAESLLQIRARDVIGKPARQVLPRMLWELVGGLDETRPTAEKEVECERADRQIIPLQISAGTLQEPDGTPQSRILILKDLSEIRFLRKEILRSQRLASLGRLAAGVAHEIRNPLSSIKGFATYFKETFSGEETRQISDTMIQEVDRLNRVIGQLLEFARPVKIALRPVPVERMVADSLKMIQHQAAAGRIAVESICDSSIAEIRTDPDRMHQVLLNLYLNAVQAMPAGGRLMVRVERDAQDDRYIVLRVADTGVGIREADLNQVFDPYFTTKSSGTGLGLAIVHNIIEALGGDIRIRSRVNRGTEVQIRLPDAGRNIES